MDVKKLEVDESQISKTTGRIILPADDAAPAAPKSHSHRPRATPQAAPQQPHPVPQPAAQHAAQPELASPAAAPAAKEPFPQAQALVIGILTALLVIQTAWLFWSHSQLQGAIRTMHDQVIKLNAEMAASGETVKSLSRELLEMKVLLGRAAEEQKNQARSVAEIKAQLQSFDDDAGAAPQAVQP